MLMIPNCYSTHRTTHCPSDAQDFADHEGGVTKVLFGADGTCVASASEDRTIKIWDARSYNLLQHYPAHDAKITSLSMHPRCVAFSQQLTFRLC